MQTFPRSWSKAAKVICAYLPAVIFALTATAGGTPALRHDWLSIAGRSQLATFTLSTLAWVPNGIGSVRVYPTDYIFAILNTGLAVVAGTHVALFVLVALVGAMCVFGARSVASLDRNGPLATFALSCFALFNPWVYVKLIEGHLAMIAAYGALMALVAELLRRRPNWTLAAFLLAPMAQLQFFVLGIAACACAGTLRQARAALIPLTCGFIFVFPSLIGFIFDGKSVLAIPYNVDWQTNQSVSPVDAAALSGFFTNYARGLPPIAFDAVWSFAALALIGSSAVLRVRTLATIVIAFLAWALSTGTKGPFAVAYVTIVEHFPPIQLYRELYDVLGLLAIAYIFAAAVATARFPLLGRLAVVPGLILLGCWFYVPPHDWWISLSELPTVKIDAPPNSRFALYPDLEPLRFDQRGSGKDPDAFPRAGNVTPLNGSEVAFPARVALRQYALSGNVDMLRALGVSRIYSRSWLRIDPEASSAVSALSRSGSGKHLVHSSSSLHAESELSLVESLSVTRGLPSIGSGQIFFSDVAGFAGTGIPPDWARFVRIHLIHPPLARLKATDDWVDVRQAFLVEPDLGQALGGALTTSHSAELPIDGSGSILVNVLGSLRSATGLKLTGTTRGYTWIAVPPETTAVICSGECAVAARGDAPSLVQSPRPAVTRLQVCAPLPWLGWARLPARRRDTVLRYLITYDQTMIALTPSGMLPHLRIETAFNGWLVTSHTDDLTVVFVDLVSAAQLIFELVGFCLFAILALRIMPRIKRIH